MHTSTTHYVLWIVRRECSPLTGTEVITRKLEQYWSGFRPGISVQSTGEAERFKGKADFGVLEPQCTVANR